MHGNIAGLLLIHMANVSVQCKSHRKPCQNNHCTSHSTCLLTFEHLQQSWEEGTMYYSYTDLTSDQDTLLVNQVHSQHIRNHKLLTSQRTSWQKTSAGFEWSRPWLRPHCWNGRYHQRHWRHWSGTGIYWNRHTNNKTGEMIGQRFV